MKLYQLLRVLYFDNSDVIINSNRVLPIRKPARNFYEDFMKDRKNIFFLRNIEKITVSGFKEVEVYLQKEKK